MNLFRKAKPKASAAAAAGPKDAIVKLRETLEMLEKREKHLQSKIDNETRLAKENASKNKRVALMALKKKKVYEAELEKSTGARMTLETQMMAIENANVNLEALHAMKAGSQAMSAIHGEMDINKVDSTMEDIRDQMDLAAEISQAISQPVGFGMDMDEDELNAELEELEQEELDSKLLSVEPSAILSSAPSAGKSKLQQPTVTKQDEITEEDEIEMLRASMA